MSHAFFLGVDVAPTDEESVPDVTHAMFEKSTEGTDEEATYRLNHMRRHTDVASADDFADHLQGLVAEQPYIGRTSLIVNRNTEFGQALIEALEDRGMDPVGATLSEGAGAAVGETDDIGVHLGGIDVVRTIAELHRDGKIAFESHTTEVASRLARDVQALAEQLDEADGDIEALGQSTAGPSFDPEATHVNGAALAVWLGSERSFDPSQHLKESPQTGSVGGT
jgi:hypothetical protein